MGTFVSGNTALPAQKTDAYPPTGLSTELDAADINNLWNAAGDLRTHGQGFVNVMDQGAVGDFNGSTGTDDTAAIQAAVTAAAGGTVVIPAGKAFKVTSTINVPTAGTKFVGGGKIFMAFASSLPASGILFNVTASNVEFDGIWIDSTGTAVTTTVNKYVIKFVGTSGTHLTGSRVTRCRFTNLAWEDTIITVVATHAIYAAFADLSTFRDNTFDNIGGAAIFTTQLDGLKVLSNNINNTGWYSIQLQALVTNALISGNTITGTLPGSRVWGGSINLMSNGTGTVGEGLGRDSNITVTDNYISGVHSYTAAVHIESSSHVIFARNRLENITLTSAADMLARYGQVTPFYPDGSSPVYVRPYTRTVDLNGDSVLDIDEGSCDHIYIDNNELIAVGTNAIGIYVDNQHKPAVTTLADTCSITNNKVISPGVGNTFKGCIAVHGQDGGWKSVQITGNQCSGAPTDANPVGGLIGTLALTTAPVTEVQIIGNNVEYIGTPTTSTHTGIVCGDFVQRVFCHSNTLRNCWNGIRILTTNAGPVFLGAGNAFVGSGSADYLFSGGPTANIGTVPRYGSLILTGRASNLAATSLVATAAVGEYRVCVTARTTTSGTGTTATVSIIWTDEGGVKTFTTPSFALNAVDLTGQVNATIFVHAAVSTNIQVSVTGTYGTSQYAISAIAEKLN